LAAKSAVALLAILASLVASSASADPETATADPEVLQWTFTYSGARISARGVVVTAAIPEPDGSYRILSITGKRNGQRIVELVPEGEFVTTHGFLVADNRLLAASPFVGEAGFSFRTADSQYFNVCHAGEGSLCGREGYREYDDRSVGRRIRLEITRVPIEARPVEPNPPDARIADDS
jgi:hypothetical protein